MKLGFIGTGVISDAMIRGLLSTGDAVSEIIVSRRGREFSQKLATEFDTVRVEDDNQAIMDAADIVFLAVRPQIAEQVLSRQHPNRQPDRHHPDCKAARLDFRQGLL